MGGKDCHVPILISVLVDNVSPTYWFPRLGEEALNIAIKELWDPTKAYFILYTLIWVIKIIKMEKIK